MAAANKRDAEVKARSVIHSWAIGFASVAWIPFSHYAMAAGDVALVMQVGSIYNVDVDRSAAGVIFTTVSAYL
jgi:uncharacterized protein (DUF697 family)